MPKFLKVAKTTEMPPDGAKAVDIGARRIAIFNIEGTYYAIDDACTHRGGPLSEGPLVTAATSPNSSRSIVPPAKARAGIALLKSPPWRWSQLSATPIPSAFAPRLWSVLISV
jgi:hypothetical protein